MILVIQARKEVQLDLSVVAKHLENIREELQSASDKLKHVLDYHQALGLVTEVEKKPFQVTR